MQYFNIQVASQLSGVASATIRAWEKRYKAVVPQRGDNKHRLYSEKDIEKLTLLFRLTELGQSIGRIAYLDIEELKKIYSSLMHRPYENSQFTTPDQENIDIEKMLKNFFIALSAYKLDIISHELEKAKNILTPRDLCLKLLVPLFREIGIKVFNNELSIAQEHTLSAIFSFHIGQMIGIHYQKKNLKDKLVLITTPEGEMHEIGIMASALLCVHYGIKFIFLGANLPAKSLVEAANALRPKAILLGVIKGHEISEHKTLTDYLSELTTKLNVTSEIWVGGNLRPYIRTELDKRKIPFFPSLESFDEFLSKF
jgi:DNA-binding transcriptional MerR regulator/methylmalonyl-CoA mutase cobalamin-binding subunit